MAQDLKSKLTPLQYYCTQEEGTEPPFENEFWNHKEAGLYVDVVSGEPLFLSLDKYDSGSGWPSFTRPAPGVELRTKLDFKIGIPRIEVRSKVADSHLGHVFDDGPEDRGGKRYCINSASLRFVPLQDLKKEGYGAYLFEFYKDEKTRTSQNWELATLAGGCFWGLEHLLHKYPGVIETQVGYTGGDPKRATYTEVKKGDTGHAESVQALFDAKKVSFEQILYYFFSIHDPTTENRQGNDYGSQYRSAIFPHTEAQKKIAEAVIEKVNRSGKWHRPVVTRIEAFSSFFRAESYHQKYLERHPDGYSCHFDRGFQF